MIRTLFLSMQDLGKGARRPPANPPTEVKKLGVLGAGMMGAGIAYVSALAGIEVVLIDRRPRKRRSGQGPRGEAARQATVSAAARRRTRRRKCWRGSRRPPTMRDLKDADLIIEAVFEDRAVKAEVTKKAEARDRADARSSAPTPPRCRSRAWPKPASGPRTSSASTSSRRSTRWAGRDHHGQEDGRRALATAIDYVQQDQEDADRRQRLRGFYTSRCFGTYVGEGHEMLAEGIAPGDDRQCRPHDRHAAGPAGSARRRRRSTPRSRSREQTPKDLGDQ